MPIQDHALRTRVNHGITHSSSFLSWEAAIAAGATLTELYEWDRTNKFPSPFKAKVVAWYMRHTDVEAHMADAAQPKKRG